jgi:AcrR family transcriptional regulator
MVKIVKRQSYHHGDLRQALIDAAVELLSESGLYQLSLRQVARDVGVSHAAPYRHFEDKDALLAVVAEEGFKALTQRLQQTVDMALDDPVEQYLGFGRAYVHYALDNPTHYRLMFGEFPLGEKRFEPLNQQADAAFNIMIEVIAAGQRCGLFRPGNAHTLALGSWTQVHGLSLLLLARRLEIQDNQTADDIINSLGQSMLMGVAFDGVCAVD